MIKLNILAGFLLLAGYCMAQSLNPYFYYYEGKKHNLELNPDYVFVEMTDPGVAQSNALLRTSTLLEDKSTAQPGEKVWMEVNLTKLRAADYSAKIGRLKETSGVTSVTPYFTAQNGNKVALTDYFYVKLENESDVATLREYSAGKQVEIVSQDEFMPLWYQLSARNSGMNAMECANMYYESGQFACAEPDLVSIRSSQSRSQTDESPAKKAQSRIVGGESIIYYPTQWGLKNTGQYNGVAGKDINMPASMPRFYVKPVIAVVDQGVQKTHPSLSPIMNSYSYDAQSNTSPSKSYGYQATGCAGIALAKPISTCNLQGVCQYGTLMDISHSFGSAQSTAGFARGINAAVAAGADVISNSWGDDTPSQLLMDAVINAATNGRYGLGCVVVFAAGNENTNTVSFPGEMDEVITVGAMSNDGKRKVPTSADGEDWWGSNYGLGLDMMAPGVLISTTDLTGTSGYNPYSSKHPGNFTNYNYDKFFNGTAASVPFVSAAAAMLIAANPTLSLEMVRKHLFSNTTKIPGAPYSSSTKYGSWNKEVGYGLLNVQKSLLAANNDALFIIGTRQPIGETYGSYRLKYTHSSDAFPTGSNSRVGVYWSVNSTAFEIMPVSFNDNTVGVRQVRETSQLVTLTAKIWGLDSEYNQINLQTVTAYLNPEVIVPPTYSVVQNPVSDVVRVRKTAGSDENAANASQLRSSSDITLCLYSGMTLERSAIFSSSDEELAFDVSGMSPGNYVLRVMKGSEVILTQQIIIK